MQERDELIEDFANDRFSVTEGSFGKELRGEKDLIRAENIQ